MNITSEVIEAGVISQQVWPVGPRPLSSGLPVPASVAVGQNTVNKDDDLITVEILVPDVVGLGGRTIWLVNWENTAAQAKDYIHGPRRAQARNSQRLQSDGSCGSGR